MSKIYQNGSCIIFWITHSALYTIQPPFFWLECISAVAVLGISGYETWRLSQPEYSERGRFIGYVFPLIIWILFVGLHLIEALFSKYSAGCSQVVTMIEIVPTLLMFLLVKRAAPIRFFLIGSMVVGL